MSPESRIYKENLKFLEMLDKTRRN